MSPEVELIDWMASRFNGRELWQFLGKVPGGEEVRQNLRPDSAVRDLAHDAISALSRRGAFERRFFQMLVAERPLRAKEITSLARMFGHADFFDSSVIPDGGPDALSYVDKATQADSYVSGVRISETGRMKSAQFVDIAVDFGMAGHADESIAALAGAISLDPTKPHPYAKLATLFSNRSEGLRRAGDITSADLWQFRTLQAIRCGLSLADDPPMRARMHNTAASTLMADFLQTPRLTTALDALQHAHHAYSNHPANAISCWNRAFYVMVVYAKGEEGWRDILESQGHFSWAKEAARSLLQLLADHDPVAIKYLEEFFKDGKLLRSVETPAWWKTVDAAVIASWNAAASQGDALRSALTSLRRATILLLAAVLLAAPRTSAAAKEDLADSITAGQESCSTP